MQKEKEKLITLFPTFFFFLPKPRDLQNTIKEKKTKCVFDKK